MTLAEGTPVDWAPVGFPVPQVEIVSKGGDRPPLPIVHFPRRPRRYPSAGL